MILVGDFIPKDLKVRLPDEFKGKIVLANLEGPICADGLSTSNKVGICLHSDVEKLSGWGVEKFAFSLANNHMMDYGDAGLRQTKETLASHGIPFAGAGDNEEEARKPMILEENGKRIAVFCCCERQFGMATENISGCAEKGVWLYSAIREIKESGRADFVIVSCHAANEYSPWASPKLHDFYHSLIDAGADCIHGHHAHVPQGYEEYKGRPIFYGLGNFVVDPSSWNSNSNQLWSTVANVTFGTDHVEWSVKPYFVEMINGAICVSADATDRSSLCERYLRCANRQFESLMLLEACWQEAACRLYDRLYGVNIRTPPVRCRKLSLRERVRNSYFLLMGFWAVLCGRESPSKKSLFYAKVVYNAFNCSSHVSSISTALGVFTGAVVDLRCEVTARLAEELGVD